jgi:hypothetical protein
MKKQEEESKRVRDLLEVQKKNMQDMKVSITGFDTKIDGLGKMVKMLMEEQDRVKNLVKTWERKWRV